MAGRRPAPAARAPAPATAPAPALLLLLAAALLAAAGVDASTPVPSNTPMPSSTVMQTMMPSPSVSLVPCAPGEYNDGTNTCRPCSTCGMGFYQGAPCMRNADTVCLPLVQQCINLTSGFNTISFNVLPLNGGGIAAFVPTLMGLSISDLLISEAGFAIYTGRSWSGLGILPPLYGERFQVLIQAPSPPPWCVFGVPMDPSIGVPVMMGSNFVGYTLQEPVPINEALRLFPAQTGDTLIAPVDRGGGATYLGVGGLGWLSGTPNLELQPGVGYLLLLQRPVANDTRLIFAPALDDRRRRRRRRDMALGLQLPQQGPRLAAAAHGHAAVQPTALLPRASPVKPSMVAVHRQSGIAGGGGDAPLREKHHPGRPHPAASLHATSASPVPRASRLLLPSASASAVAGSGADRAAHGQAQRQQQVQASRVPSMRKGDGEAPADMGHDEAPADMGGDAAAHGDHGAPLAAPHARQAHQPWSLLRLVGAEAAAVLPAVPEAAPETAEAAAEAAGMPAPVPAAVPAPAPLALSRSRRAAPRWQPRSGLQFSMFFIIRVLYNLNPNRVLGSEGSVLAVFDGADVVGRAVVNNITEGANEGDEPFGPLFLLQCASDSQEKEGLTLRAWDAARDKIFQVEGTVTFRSNMVVGSLEDPYVREVVDIVTCEAGEEYETAAPTPTSDRLCAQCDPPCTSVEYEAVPCTPTSNRDCQRTTRPCLFPGVITYEAAPPTPTSDRVCRSVSSCEAGVTYETAPPTATSNRVCTDATQCEQGVTYQTVAPTLTSDRVCGGTVSPPCDAGTAYQGMAPTLTSDRVCSPVQQCTLGQTYETQAPTPTTDRTCRPTTECDDRLQYAAVRATLTSDRTCAALAPPQRIAPRVSIADAGAILSRPAAGDAGAGSQTFSAGQLRLGTAPQGTVQASLGERLTATAQLQRRGRPAQADALALLQRATLLSPLSIHSDEREVSVAVQLLDQFGGGAAASATPPERRAALALVPDATLQSRQDTVPTGTCAPPEDGSGVCILRVSAPAAWFTSSGGAGNGTFQVQVGPNDGLYPQGSRSLATVAVRDAVPQPSVSADVLAVAPLRRVLPGETVTIQLLAEGGGRAVRGWELGLSVAAGLSLTSVSVDATWSAEPVFSSDRLSASIVGIPADPSARPQGQTDGSLEPLASVRVTADAGLAAAATLDIAVTIFFLSNVEGTKLTPRGMQTPTAARVLDFAGDHVSPARLRVVPETVKGIYPVIAQAELVNTAAIDRQAVSVPLSTLAVSSTGSVTPLTDGLSCTALRPGVAQVEGDCSQARLSGRELGSGVALWRTTYTPAGGPAFAAERAFTVWLPVSADITVADPTLSPTDGWAPSGETCATDVRRYQRSRVAISIAFASNGTAPFTIDATAMVTDHLVADDAGLVNFVREDSFGLSVEGVRPGTTSVRLAAFNGLLLGEARVTVEGPCAGDSCVRPVRLDVYAFSAIEVAPASVSLATDDAATFSIAVATQLEAEFQRAQLVGQLVFSDNSTYRLLPGDFDLRATGSEVALTERSGELEARASGQGTLAVANWTSPAGCATPVMLEAPVELTVALPAATAVSVRLASSTLAPPGSSATLRGIQLPSSTTVQVLVSFEDGSERDLSADARLTLASAEPAIATVARATDTSSYTVNAQSTLGRVSLTASFDHLGVTGAASLEVVDVAVVTLRFSPYPLYPGSLDVDASPLNRIADTGQRQQGAVTAVAQLSGGTEVDISASADLGFDVLLAGSASPSTGVLERVGNAANSGGRSVFRAVAAGSVDLVATYGDVRGVPLRIVSLDTRVQVAAITDVAVPTTLRGQAGSTTAGIRAGVRLTDDTRLPPAFLFPTATGGPSLPNLLNFSVADAAGATVGLESGVLLLQGNLPFETVVSIASLGSSALQQRNMACNLDPLANDGDIGAVVGVPVEAQSPGDVFTVDVRINVGGSSVRTVKLAIDYAPGLVEATAAVAGPGWPGGQFLATLNDPPGRIAFGGASNAFSGTATIARVTFRLLSSVPRGSLVNLRGVILTLATGDGTLLAPAEQAFVAGSVSFQVASSGRRRRSAAGPQDAEPPAVAGAPGAVVFPAATAVPQALPQALPQAPRDRARRADDCEVGDTDGNCVFDLRDATFARDYLARVKLDASYGSDFSSHQLENLDIDRNGERNADDAAYLASVDFRLYRFFANLTVQPVSNATDCLFVVEATLLLGGDAPATRGNTALFVDVDSRSASAQSFLDNAIVTEGLLAVADKGPSSSGRVFQAGLDNADGRFRLALAVPGPLTDIGVSLVIVTLDRNGETSAARTTAVLGGSPDAPFTFPSSLDLTLTLNGTGGVTTSVATEGYNPLAVVSNGQGSLACNAETVCPAEAYVSSPATPTSEPTCSRCSQCQEDEYIASECQEAQNRVCDACTECSVGSFAALNCSASADTVCEPCTACGPGSYAETPCTPFADADCQLCRVCGADEFQVSPCSAANNTVCATCASCGPDEFEEVACQATEDTVCTACTTCDDGEYVATGCSADADTDCRPCTTCEPGVTFATANCSSVGGNTICSPCASCAADEYEASACTPFQDTVCLACASCAASEFEARPCSGANNTVCEACSSCAEGFFVDVECSATADTVCAACSSCASGEYALAACGADADTDCRACSTCAAGEFVAASCSATNDTQCASCSVCGAGEYILNECSAMGDTQCASCSVCGAGEFEAAACTASNDTACQTCSTCAADQYVAAPCSALNDTVCQACSSCASDQYVDVPCSALNDTQCAPCSGCAAGEFIATPCSASTDDVCAPCASCSAEEYIATACGGANDTVCAPLTTCGPSEVVSVPATPTSDRQCEPAVAGLPPPVTLEEGVGLGFWLDPASQTALGVTERPVGGYVNGEPGSSGQVTASLGDTRVSASYSRAAGEAASVVAVVSDLNVWYDAPEVTVWVQVYDSRGNAQVQRQTVRATLTPSGFGGAAATATCRTASSSGQCAIRVSVPASYFGSGNEVRTATVGVVLEGGSGDGAAAALGSRGVVTLQPQPSPAVTADVLQAMPFASVYRGDSFSVSVLAQGGGFALSSWRLRISLPQAGRLRITSVTVDKSIWSESVSIAADGQSAAVTAGVADALSRPQDAYDEVEALCEVTLRVESGAATDEDASVLTEVVDLFNSRGQSVLTTPQDALSLDRYGERRGAGRVFVAEDAIVGLLARPSAGELVNVAAVGGSAASATVSVCGVSLSGRQCGVLSSGLSCTGDDDAALSVSGDCARVSAVATATRGSGGVTVTAQHAASGSETAFVMRAWYPQSPVELSVSDRQLSPIAGWRAASPGCGQEFQTADVRVYARLEAGSMNVIERVGLTIHAASAVQSDAPGVAVVDAGRRQVLAVSAGNATLQLQVAGSSVTSNSVVVTVTSAAVSVESLEATVVTGLTLGGVGGTVAAGDSGVASVTVGRRLTQEFERADVYVRALLSDGQSVAVSEAMGLELASLDRAVLRIVNDTGAAATEDVEAVGSGQGLLLSAVWRDVSGCPGDGGAIGSGLGFVDVRLPRPERAVVVVSASTLVPSGDPAATLPGVATSATVRVFLEFPSGRQQELTRDARTRVNVTNLALSREADGSLVVRAASPSAPAGTGTVSVSFTHENVTASATVVIATLSEVRLSLHPFPRYPGSRSFDERVLSPIAGTGVMQRAELVTVVELSTGAETEVSSDGQTSYGVSDGSLFSVSGAVLSVAAGASVPSGGTVTATYNGVSSQAEAVQASDVAVSVTSVDGLTLPGTLSGQRGVATAQATCGVTLSDTTRWTTASLFPGGALALPNLLRFEVSETSAATVDASSGEVTLVDNWYETVDLTAEALDSGVDAVRAFACNVAPLLGDVDVGSVSGVPVPPVSGGVGSEFSVDVRVRVGSTALRSVQLSMTYPSTLLRVVSVSRGADWPGGPFEFNDDTPGAVSFGGASDAVTGTPALATVRFRVVGEGLATLGGVVTTLADVDGSNIGSRVGLTFDAGMVPVRLGSGRRRRQSGADSVEAEAEAEAEIAAAGWRRAAGRSAEALPAALRRGRRAESCSPKPCAVCPEGRQTGDTDGDCLFDVRDVTFLREYLNLQALNPSDPALQDILPVQADSFDVDGNGRNNTEDFTFLLKVNFGLYYFVRDLSVTPVEESGSDCRLSVSVRLIGGGAGRGDSPADGNRTFVFFDIESEAGVLSQQLSASVVTLGSAAAVDKGAAYNGGLWRAAAQGSGLFVTEVASQLNVTAVGLSLIQGTLDPSGQGLPARTTLMTGDPVRGAGFLFEGTLAFDLEVNAQTTVDIVSEGYNPRLVFSASETSLECQQAKGCAAGEYIAVPATLTLPPLCLSCSACGPDEFEVEACSAFNDTLCESCSSCGQGFFVDVACSATADTVCETCSSCPFGQYEETPCSMMNDTDCRACSTCGAGEFEAASCSATNDTLCASCTVCGAGEYILNECSATEDTLCANCSTCAADQYVAAPCSALNDTVCQACSSCASDQYVDVPCSALNDTQCAPCSGCAAGEFIATPCSASTDDVCAPCASCSAEEYIATACGGANDTVCAPLTTCGPSEVVSVPATPTSDRQCEPAVAGLPPPVTLEEGVGLGFWLDPASQTALGVTERPVGGYVNGEPGSSGQVTASLGDTRVSASYSRAAGEAASVVAVVSDLNVWYDAPEVTVWVQVYDSRGNAQVQRQTVRATLTPSGFGGAAATATCRTASSSGQCAIRVSVPASYFGSGNEVRTATVGVVLEGGSGDGAAAALGSRGVVTLQPQPSPAVTADVLQAMPFASVYRGDSFSVSVLAQGGGFALSSWRLRISLPQAGRLRITSVTVDKSIWSESVSIAADGQSAAVTAGVADALSRPQDAYDEVEALCEVTLRVESGAATDEDASVLTEVVDLFNSRGQSVLTTPQDALSLDRYGERRGAGRVFVAEDAIVGLLARPSAGELVNVAAVGGSAASATVSVCGVSLSGRQCGVLSSGLSCTGDDDAALSVSGDCARVSAVATATRGSGGVTVTAQHAASGSETAFVMRAWYPQSPVELSVSDRQLSPIAGWRAASPGCGQEFQTADVRVYARLEAGSMNVIERVGLTIHAASAVQSDAPGVAVVDAGRRQVLAVSAGNATLQLQVAGSSVTSNSVVVTVTSAAVSVESLEATVVTGLTLGGVGGTVAAGDSGVASVTVGRRLTQEFERADVYVRALLSDGQSVAVSEAMGLELASLDRAVLRIVNDTGAAATEDVEAVGSGQGLLLSAVWRDVSGCPGDGGAIGSGLGFVDVRLPRPERAVVVVSASTLVPSGDPAATLPGVATSATVRVFLEFPSGRQQELTRDARTRVNVTNLALSREADGSLVVRAASPSAPAGTGTVSVSFTHENVTASATVVIATLSEVRLSLHPFPRYPGSRSFDERVLSPIAGTGVMQRAELVTVVELSTGAETEVSSDGQTSYGVSDGSLFSVSGAVLSVAAGASVPSGGTVTATYNGVSSQAEAVQASDVAVSVTSVDGLTLPGTLSGQRGVATAQATCGVTLSDTTRWTTASLFPGGALALPNLLRFEVSETSAATVDASSGEVTLVDNWYETVDLTAEALDSGVDAVRAFACNVAPLLGDVDVGSVSGVPVPPVSGGVGSEFSVDVRVRVGSTALRSVQLSMTYPSTLLRVVSVSRGADWPGGPFEFNDDTPGAVSFGGASDAVTGTPALATVRFRVVGEGLATLGGVVTTLADVDGSNIGSRVGLTFDAGMVPVRLGSGRRRRQSGADSVEAEAEAEAEIAAAGWRRAAGRSAEALPAALRRGRRAESCSPKPCAVCPEGRQTGDTDGDCLFDVRDVTFLREYLNLQALNPSDPALQDILPVQADSFDVDGNGRNNTEDFTFLLKVNFGLYYFVRDLSVTPVEESGSDCRLSVSVRLIGGGAGRGDSPADGNRTFVFFDIESEAGVLSQQLSASVVTLGSAAAVDKGAAYNGGLWRAAAQGSGLFVTEVASQLNVTAVGLSLIQGTLDPSGQGLPARTTLMTGDPVRGAGFLFEGTLAFDLEVNAQTTVDIVSEGYNPRLVFSASETSLECQQAKGCAAGEYIAVPATLTLPPLCLSCSACGPGEFVSVPCQADQDTVCAPRGRFVPPVSLAYQSSGALLTGSFDEAMYNGSATQGTVYSLDLAGGAVVGSVGGVSQRQPVPPLARELTPVLIDNAVTRAPNGGDSAALYVDGSTLEVLLRVRNADGSVALTASRPVVVRLHLLRRGSDTGASDVVEARCTPSRTRGTCSVSLTAPTDWFVSSGDGLAGYSVCFADDASCLAQPENTLPTYTLAATPSLPDNEARVVTTLPQRDVFPGATLVLPVTVRRAPGVVSFALQASSSGPLELVELRFGPEWSPVWDLEGGVLFGNALLSRPESVDPAVQEEISLCEVVVRVPAGAQSGLASLSVTFAELVDANSNRIRIGSRLTDIPSAFLQRGGFSEGGANVQVHITRPVLTGAFVDVGVSEVINFGALLGDATEVPLQWTTLLSDGTIGTAPPTTDPALECTTSRAELASATAGCTRLSLTQTLATEGAVSLRMTAAGLSDEVQLNVLAFQTVRLKAGSVRLAAIAGLGTGAPGCSMQFQVIALSVIATLKLRDGTLFDADVTNTVPLAQLSSDSPLVATIEAVRGVVSVVGQSPGAARLRLALPAAPDVALDVNVGGDTVSISRLDIAVVSGIDVSASRTPGGSERVEVQAVPHSRLEAYGQDADVYVSALLSDGSRQDVTASPHLVLRLDTNGTLSLIPDSTGLQSRAVRVQQPGTALLEATLASPACAGGQALAAGSLLVVPSLPNAADAVVRLSAAAIARASDPAACAGTATSAALVVELVLENGARLDISRDATLSVSAEAPLAVRVTDQGRREVFVTAAAPEVTGTFTVTVTIPQLGNATRNASLGVLAASALVIRASPFPVYPGSSSVLASPLNPIARTGTFQEAVVAVELILAPGNAAVAVSSIANLSLTESSTPRFTLSPASRVLRTLAPRIEGAQAELRADLCGLSAPAATVDVSLTPVEVDTFDDVSFPSTFGGVQGTRAPVRFGVTLTDGTQWTSAVLTGAGTGPALPGLVSFTSADPSRVAMDSATGVAELRGSSPAPIALTLRAPRPSTDVIATVATTANLAPAVGDVDLGRATGAPVAPTRIGDRFSVAVRVNSGGQSVGALELAIRYDPTQLRALSARAGADWAAGAFIATLNDPPGVLLLGGTPSTAAGVVELGLVEFEVVAASAGLAAIGGEIVTLATDNQIAIGTGAARDFVAGEITVLLEERRRRRRGVGGPGAVTPAAAAAETATGEQRVRRASRCSTPPCASCEDGPRETGDVNGDCVFDVNDVTYLQRFLLLQARDANAAAALLPAQREEIDVDLSGGMPNTQDALFLLRVNFRQLRFVRDVSLEEVSDQTNCTLRLRARVSRKGNAAVSSTQTAIYFVLESTEGRALSNATRLVVGEASQPVLGASSGRSEFEGVIWQAHQRDDTPFIFEASAEVPYGGESLGISIVQVTTDAERASIPTRRLAMTGVREAPFTFPGGLQLLLPLPQDTDRGSVAFGSTGYNPLRTLLNGVSTETCAIPAPTAPPAGGEGEDNFWASTVAIIVIVLLAILGCLFCCCIIFCCRRRMPRDEETGLFYTRSASYNVQASARNKMYRTPARGGVTLLRQGVLQNEYSGVDPGYKYEEPRSEEHPLGLFSDAIDEASSGAPEVVPPVENIQETDVDRPGEATTTPERKPAKPMSMSSVRKHLLEAADGVNRAFVTNPFDPRTADPDEDLYSDDEEEPAGQAATATAWGTTDARDHGPGQDGGSAADWDDSASGVDLTESFREAPQMEAHNRDL